ncbi:type-1 angiotensin II receptor-associated protein isoform X2 [Cryptotermes secundus]|uniref:type-1 angiotensin II receptor-associated protein isoform X2 n=1 Tax=Cryptotermes secundus TaxID=105785 RepID=UPI000CD7CA9F|nr:type-1 angiotensin II receptor-associated protein isoform X2 [Cryptotermes secundus]
MVELSDIPSAPLKVVFVVHFILSAWYPANSSILIHDGVLPGKQIGIFVNMGLGHWCPLSYLFYNLLFFLILLWAVHHKESDEPMQMAVAVNAVCLVLDVMVISLYFPRSNDGSERFSCGMAILNLIIRPFTTLVLYRIYVERANAVGAPLPTIFGGTAQRGPYEDIVGAVHQSVPHTDIPSPVEYAPSSKMPPPYHS